MSDEKPPSELLHGFGYLLHVSTPTKLLGSIASETEVAGAGRILLNLSQDSTEIRTTYDDQGIILQLEEESALELAKQMLRLAAENRALRALAAEREKMSEQELKRGEFAIPSRAIMTGESGVSCRISAIGDRKKKGVISLEISGPDVCLGIDNTVQIQLSENLGVRVAEALIDTVGQLGARRATEMIEEARRERAEFERNG